MRWSPVSDLKPSAEKSEERVIVKMINEDIIKALLKSKIIYSFKLIYSHGLAFGIISLSMFLLMKAKNLLLAGLVKSLVLKKNAFVFIRKYVLVFYQWACKF